MTSGLDPEAYPILDLICAYLKRREIKSTLDEIATHQPLLPDPLRSRKPVGAIQELYISSAPVCTRPISKLSLTPTGLVSSAQSEFCSKPYQNFR